MDADERRFWRWASRNKTRAIAPDVRTCCWIWCGARNAHKQPVFFVDGKMRYAAVWLWERTYKREKPPGMQLSPVCRESMCIRPDHRQLRRRGSHLRRN